jgi:farnesyl diphosphate synthase
VSHLAELALFQQRSNQFLTRQIDQLPITDQRLLDAMRYGLLIGGKRLRPYLSYITGQTLGAHLSDIDAVAAAIECIHAYSLLHDDLPAMDNDDLRRGQKTCHKAFDEATAILAGDALQTLAFEILAEHEFKQVSAQQRIQLFRLLSQASGYQGMCGGQALDIAATDHAISLAELERLHSLKTGALLKACVLMAAQCVPAVSKPQLKSLTLFADCIGLAYQVRDDIIDITSSEQELGKPAGSDLALNKSTYPALLGLQGAQQKADQLYQQSLQALHELPYNTENLSNFATFIVNRTS